jgi:hypothetical protein
LLFLSSVGWFHANARAFVRPTLTASKKKSENWTETGERKWVSFFSRTDGPSKLGRYRTSNNDRARQKNHAVQNCRCVFLKTPQLMSNKKHVFSFGKSNKKLLNDNLMDVHDSYRLPTDLRRDDF